MSDDTPSDRPRTRERLVVCHRHLPKALAEDGEQLGQIHVWSRTVAGRFMAAGAELHAHVSGTVIASFDAADLADAIEVGLDLLDEADDAQLAIGLGVALGILHNETASGREAEAGATWEYGAALERAQVLASRVPAGELALDGEARARARGLLLFSKQISPGHGLRGYLVDRSHPRRDASALAMKRLGEPALPPITRALLPALKNLIERSSTSASTLEGELEGLGRESPPVPLVVLRGPPGAGAIELLEAARRSIGAVGARSRLFTIGATPSAAVPLGSLRAMLMHYDLVQGAMAGHRSVLELVTEGALPSRESLVQALAATLPDPAWILLAPLVEVDLATLSVIAALRTLRPRTVVVGRYGLDLPVPAELGRGQVVELTLPALRTADARVVAQELLGEATDSEVARRVAVLGGETPLGVLEAARTLIACGELVLDEDAFVFRSGGERGNGKGRSTAISLDLLIAERAEMLDDESRQCIEALSILAEPVPMAELEAVLSMDRLPPRAVSRALGRLDDDGWIERSGTTGPGAGAGTVRCANVYVRHLLEASLHPARRAELHRFAFEALKDRRDGPSGHAELGLHQIEGGRDAEGAARLLEAAEATLAAGYGRAAARLAVLSRKGLDEVALAQRATAIVTSGVVQSEGGLDVDEEDWLLSPRAIRGAGEPRDAPLSGEIEVAAPEPKGDSDRGPGTVRIENAVTPETATAVGLELAPLVSRRPKSLELTASSEGSAESVDLVAEVTAAIRERDAERIEHIARRAVLDGVEMAHVARLRALADLLRGDVSGAARGLVRARSLRPAAPVGRRALLTEAMVSLRAGASTTAVRFALRALADARREGDARGESVALFTMAAGYRALGREDDATRLEQRAQFSGA